MLHDPFGRKIIPGLDGWSQFQLIPADQASQIKGLEEIAAYVNAGTMPGDTPIFTAVKRTDAPWPDVRVAVPLEPNELAAWQAGDDDVARDILAAMEDFYEGLMRAAKANQVN